VSNFLAYGFVYFFNICLLNVNFREDFTFNITMFFEAYVRQWLINTDRKTKSWVEAVSIYILMWLIMQLMIDVFSSLSKAIAQDKVIEKGFNIVIVSLIVFPSSLNRKVQKDIVVHLAEC
jgi:hypothetical protein